MLAQLLTALPAPHPPLPSSAAVTEGINALLTALAAQRTTARERHFVPDIGATPAHATVAQAWSPERRGRLVVYLLETEAAYAAYAPPVYGGPERAALLATLPEATRHGLDDLRAVFRDWAGLLLRHRLPLSATLAADIATALHWGTLQQAHFGVAAARLDGRPIGHFLQRLAAAFDGEPLPRRLRVALVDLRNALAEAPYFNTDARRRRLLRQLDERLRASDDGGDADTAAELDFAYEDPVSILLTDSLSELPAERQAQWVRFVRHALTNDTLKVRSQYAQTAGELVAAIGAEDFRRVTDAWRDYLLAMPRTDYRAVVATEPHRYLGMFTGYLTPSMTNVFRGVAQARGALSTPADVAFLEGLATWAERTVPGVGPRAKPLALALACFRALANVPDASGAAALVRLRARIKRPAILKFVDRFVAEAAERLGLDREALADETASDFGLTLGTLSRALGDYTAHLAVEAPGRATLSWTRPDGKPQKTVPKAVKEGHPEALAALKPLRKRIAAESTVQRERFEGFYRDRRRWRYAAFAKTVHAHGLLGWFSRKLIWQVGPRALRYDDGAWRTAAGEAYAPGPEEEVRLWHPAEASAEEVAAWRAHAYARELVQPFKQAFREVYVVTPAEEAAGDRSARFAEHVLYQNKLHGLCRGRSWQTTHLGAFDGGDETAATTTLPAYGLRASWTLRQYNTETDAYGGFFAYVETGALTFAAVGAPYDAPREPLAEVDAVAFSEVMRDADLFVSVAGVASDPTWLERTRANQLERTAAERDYWRSVGFGAIGKSGETRREVLAKLLPRLKIRDVAEVTDRSLVVRGRWRTYEIHLGTANVLMSPNDQYLCIVTAPGFRRGRVFIPFEGDERLSLILSKAFLLARDDEIEDELILRQFRTPHPPAPQPPAP